jgi:hypothetical protein
LIFAWILKIFFLYLRKLRVMYRDEIIECIQIGYKEAVADRINQDNPDYVPEIHELPDSSDLAQYAREFGIMMGRVGFDLLDEEMYEYILVVLESSGSELTLDDIS